MGISQICHKRVSPNAVSDDQEEWTSLEHVLASYHAAKPFPVIVMSSSGKRAFRTACENSVFPQTSFQYIILVHT